MHTSSRGSSCGRCVERGDGARVRQVGITAPLITSPAGSVSSFTHGLIVSGTGEAESGRVAARRRDQIGTGTVAAGGAFSVSVTLDYGVHVLTAVESDSGLTSAESNSVSVTILVPAPVILSPAEHAIVAPGIVQVTGTGVRVPTSRSSSARRARCSGA